MMNQLFFVVSSPICDVFQCISTARLIFHSFHQVVSIKVTFFAKSGRLAPAPLKTLHIPYRRDFPR